MCIKSCSGKLFSHTRLTHCAQVLTPAKMLPVCALAVHRPISNSLPSAAFPVWGRASGWVTLKAYYKNAKYSITAKESAGLAICQPCGIFSNIFSSLTPSMGFVIRYLPFAMRFVPHMTFPVRIHEYYVTPPAFRFISAYPRRSLRRRTASPTVAAIAAPQSRNGHGAASSPVLGMALVPSPI